MWPDTPSVERGAIDGAASLQLGAGRLSLADLVTAARDGQPVAPLSAAVTQRMGATAAWVAETVAEISRSSREGRKPAAYYGINTGFGALAGRSALDSPHMLKILGRNLIASHSVGVGPFFDLVTVRAALLIRAQSLAQGRSGVRPLVVETLVRMLNAGVYPAIPELGSLGASGDLAPLAHLTLTLSAPPGGDAGDAAPDPTDGEAFVPCGGTISEGDRLHLTEDYSSGAHSLWRRVSGGEAMAAVGGKIALEAKEALALTNGSAFSAGIAALALYDARNLLDHAALAVAMTLEGIRGFRDPFYPQLHRARGHANAERFAARVLHFIEGSELVDPGDLHTDPLRIPPQDPYSVRCAPQVHGTIADTLDLAVRWIEMEINAATDNPLIFLELERGYKTLSGGNFHGEPVAMAMDFLAIAMTELGSMAERRMFMLTDYYPEKTYDDPAGKIGPAHGLSAFLIDEAPGREGLNCGLMMLQATAAALVSACKTLAHPDSVNSIPSSGNQEDHVSMSLNAARHAREVVRCIEEVLAFEFLCAAQAIWLQLAKRGNEGRCLGRGTGAAYAVLRESGVRPLERDRVLYPDIRTAVHLLRRGDMLAAVRGVAGLPQ